MCKSLFIQVYSSYYGLFISIPSLFEVVDRLLPVDDVLVPVTLSPLTGTLVMQAGHAIDTQDGMPVQVQLPYGWGYR